MNSCTRKQRSLTTPTSEKTKPRIESSARFGAQIRANLPVRLRVAKDRVAAKALHQASGCKNEVKVEVTAVGVHRASHSEPLGRGVHRSGGVPPLLCRQPRRGGSAACAKENASKIVLPRVRHNPSLNHRTPNGRLSWPGLGYAVHFPSPGQAILPQGSG